MDKSEIVSKLSSLGKDRVWLAEQIPYTYDTTRNSLTDKADEPSARFRGACERALKEEELRRRGDIKDLAPSIWDRVMFSGEEIKSIFEGKQAGGYDKLEDLYHDAVIVFCDDLVAIHKNTDSLSDHRPDSIEASGPAPQSLSQNGNGQSGLAG